MLYFTTYCIMYIMNNAYTESRVAIDAVLCTVHEGVLKVYLREREKEPFLGRHELLGGLLQQEETAEETLERKLHQTLGKKSIYFTQFHTFTDPQRDPRTRTVSIGYVALVPHDKIDDVNDWYDVTTLPSLAFDHHAMIRAALAYLRTHADDMIARQFMPKLFTLSELQSVYEILLGELLDVRNFRKQVLAKGLVEETDEYTDNVAHRPARLYRFT